MQDTLKLITLNTWGGRSLHPLMRFFRHHAPETDIFCLQEIFDIDQAELEEHHPDEYVRGDLFRKITRELAGFNGEFASFSENPRIQSQAIFARDTISIRTIADMVVHRPAQPKETGSAVISSRKLQYAIIETPKGECAIVNFHGLWNAGPKTDTEERIGQSKKVKEFLDSLPCPKILCGDFNLLPDTESLAILEKGMRNLVKETNTESTRTPLYRHYHNPEEPNFADYILTSPEIKVKEFKVLSDLVSDHAPLYMEFSL